MATIMTTQALLRCGVLDTVHKTDQPSWQQSFSLKSSTTDHDVAFLLTDSRSGHNQVNANTQEHDNQTSPCNQSLGAKLVRISSLGPSIWSVDGGISINIGAVLVGEFIDAVSLQKKKER